MECVICKHGDAGAGAITVTLELQGMTLVVKAVPALVCANCGEEYLDEEITARLLKLTEEVARAGIQVDIRDFVTA